MCSNMEKSKFTQFIFRILQILGVARFARYLFSCHFSKRPTQAMKDEKQFFSEHAKELQEVYDSLEDDRSRAAFENIIKYRFTYGWEYFKKSGAKKDQKNQYLVPELQFSEHEIIVDCGAFTGDTAKLFYKKIPGCSVIALEPDEKNFAALQKLKFPGLKPIKAGAWSEDTTLCFSNEGGGSTAGAIADTGEIKIEVKAIDNLPECRSATYIKMDIEGSELEALKGAENLIKNNKPKLAICIYHKPQDFFEIPLYIKKINPEYKLFVHHHTDGFHETVLYAI